jgi:membrane-bound lytic murein transglycosylase B
MPSASSLIPGVQPVQKLGREAAKVVTPVKHQQSNLSRAAEAIQRASERWHVNPAYLWGIFGVETSYGSQIAVSSTGAKGPFQFEPATAKEYGYPTGVNERKITDWSAFQQQANAAAHYLQAHGGTHDPRGAVEAYNPGEASYYGKVVAHARSYSHPFASEAANTQETETVEHPPEQKLTLLQELGKFALTAVLLLVGAVLLVYGIMVAVRPRDRALSVPTI